MGSGDARARLRRALDGDGIIVTPSVWDPFSARVAEMVGFECVGIGGYALGAHLAVTEPLLTLSELANSCRYMSSTVDIPVKVDAGTGYGEPLHVMRTIRDLEAAGAAAIHIEDQIFPKRAHYHKGIEHVVPREEAIARVKAAVAARTDPNFVIIGRTDAMRTDDFAEGIERANLYLEVGADAVMIFPNTVEEARQAPREINGPVAYVNSEGNRLNRPVFPIQELQQMGYRMVGYSATLICAVLMELRQVLTNLKTTGVSGLDPDEMIRARKDVEDLIGLERFYEIEANTVEP